MIKTSSIGISGVPLAKTVRTKVFIEEQGFQNEFDEIDNYAFHVVFMDGNKPVATGRTFPKEGSKETYLIGRIAVMPEYRKEHVGSKVVTALEEYIKKVGGKEAELSSQVQAMPFYSKLGYKQYGEIYYDEFCPHQSMIKKLI